MSAWIILLFCLLGNSGGCPQQGGSCRKDNDRDCGRGREKEFRRDDDCGCNESFEPRFEARPFAERETCGCEEKNN